MASSRQSARKSGNESGSDGQLMVEEKIVKVNGEMTIRKYAKGRFLGKGGFAKCYEFQNMETKKVCAAKIIAKASLAKNRAKQKLMSEIRIHRSLHHTNVVSFEHFFEDNENVYILLEICQNQTLNELLRRRKRLTELEVQCYSMQLLSALRYLHSHHVIHRDLKLGNLFLTDKMELKIGDFGLATKLEFEGDRKRTICGTPNYIAPEILDGKQGHSYEVDVWSFGVILYTMLIGKPPFETTDVKTTYKRIKMNAYTFPEHTIISDAAKSLITRILNLDPGKRPTIEEILENSFLHGTTTIPKLLPASTLACPPSSSYLKQFASSTSVTEASKPRLESTAPLKLNTLGKDVLKTVAAPAATTLMNTERASTSKPVATVSALPAASARQFMPSEEKKALVSVSPQTQGPSLWVKKWVDYSSKYGLGYLISNGSTGVFFNDSSKIILDAKGHHFDYIERRTTDKQDVIASHTLTDYPKELQKKVTLLQHFRSYLEGDVKGMTSASPAPLEDDHVEKDKKSGAPIYVKKWMRTRHAIMFRLSNKIVQVNFQDHTEIILSSETREVTYVNKKGERLTYPLTIALESTNAEMAKRLKYTKDILTHMLSSNQQHRDGPNDKLGPSGKPTGPLTGERAAPKLAAPKAKIQ